MALPGKKKRVRSARPLADLVGDAITSACEKRGLMGAEFITYWADIVGERYAMVTRPEKINWPRHEKQNEAAVITIRVDPSFAHILQHDWPQLQDRLNAYFGFYAIGQLKIHQGVIPITRENKKSPPRALTGKEEAKLEQLLENINDTPLQETLARLGRYVVAESGSEMTMEENEGGSKNE